MTVSDEMYFKIGRACLDALEPLLSNCGGSVQSWKGAALTSEEWHPWKDRWHLDSATMRKVLVQ